MMKRTFAFLLCGSALLGATSSCKARGRGMGKIASDNTSITDPAPEFEGIQCEVPAGDDETLRPDPGLPQPARLADPGYPYEQGGCVVDNARQEAEWAIVEDCYRNAKLPAGAGYGYLGNLVGQPKCVNVEAAVTKQVVRCARSKFDEAGWEYRTLRILPCKIFQTGLVSDHIYMGICKTNESKVNSATLCSWTDPWDGRGDFYMPGTGRNRDSHAVHFSM
mgnify:CR=1 FL=1